MNKFQPGIVVYHKATGHKCVVLKVSDEIVKVRDENDKEQDYYPQELDTQEEVISRNATRTAKDNAANEERAKKLRYDI